MKDVEQIDDLQVHQATPSIGPLHSSRPSIKAPPTWSIPQPLPCFARWYPKDLSSSMWPPSSSREPKAKADEDDYLRSTSSVSIPITFTSLTRHDTDFSQALAYGFGSEHAFDSGLERDPARVLTVANWSLPLIRLWSGPVTCCDGMSIIKLSWVNSLRITSPVEVSLLCFTIFPSSGLHDKFWRYFLVI